VLIVLKYCFSTESVFLPMILIDVIERMKNVMTSVFVDFWFSQDPTKNDVLDDVMIIS
jgi:hypothetical protein